jgi:putative chitinase
MVTANDLRRIAGAKNDHPMRHELAKAFNRHAPRYGVTAQKPVAQFLANVCEETGGFTKLVENLNYRAERLCEVWPKRFPTLASARPFANNPKALAEKVYGGRMGNEPGEGWRYAGRGPGQATGEDNYELAKELTGIDFTGHPELMAQPDEGMQAALALWRHWRLSQMAESNQTTLIRKRWNGGVTGLSNVKENYRRAMGLKLGVSEAMAAAAPLALPVVSETAAPPPPSDRGEPRVSPASGPLKGEGGAPAADPVIEDAYPALDKVKAAVAGLIALGAAGLTWLSQLPCRATGWEFFCQ